MPAPPPAPGIRTPGPLPITRVPNYGPLELPAVAGDDGPPDGLTLDAAIDRLSRENLLLRADAWQIPQARADVLQAGLRANPLVYTDAQLVPYGRYTRDRPGGPLQYDLNVTHPVDYSGKRLARAASAERVVSVIEAQYQDAVRVQVGNLYGAFVTVLEARETVRFARASVEGLTQAVQRYEIMYRRAGATRADYGRVRSLYEQAVVGLDQAEGAVLRSKRALAALLNIPPDLADGLEVRGSLADRAGPPPPAEDLVRIALAARPDLAAIRLGVGRALADERLARAERWGDAYVLYQPYTLQDNTPTGNKSATSWTLGLTAPVPLFNRNQGGVARARLNVAQTQTEVAALERQVAREVIDARRAYDLTREVVRRYEAELLPTVRRQRDDAERLFVGGETNFQAAYDARRDYNDAVVRYRDALVRHRRGMLALDTAVGARILP
jgi:cobalt-zinc-cadmium efflux system outer membrane protein